MDLLGIKSTGQNQLPLLFSQACQDTGRCLRSGKCCRFAISTTTVALAYSHPFSGLQRGTKAQRRPALSHSYDVFRIWLINKTNMLANWKNVLFFFFKKKKTKQKNPTWNPDSFLKIRHHDGRPYCSPLVFRFSALKWPCDLDGKRHLPARGPARVCSLGQRQRPSFGCQRF